MPGLGDLFRLEMKVSKKELGELSQQLKKEFHSNPEVKLACQIKAREAQAFWKSIAPVSVRPPHPMSKGSGYIQSPGDYRNSIRVKFHNDGKRGYWARVYSNDPVAHFVEYGSHPGGKNYMPEQACAARTVEHFNGHGIGSEHEEMKDLLKRLVE